MKDPINWLYPAITPYHQDMLAVSDVHQLYVEQSGNPNGKPVVFVHGGPGAGCEPRHRQFFDPSKYRIICFDQRGSGRSKPFASLQDNTTWDLVRDMEKIRQHLKIDRWQVFGGSWGSTLALAYAETHPEAVTELLLRGIFLLREEEIRWFYQEGAHHLYPDTFETYLNAIPKDERHDLVSAYYKRLTSDDKATRLAAAKAWSIWEGSTSRLLTDSAMVQKYGEDEFAEMFARIECHYFINKGFFEVDGQLLRDIHRIRHIPAVIVQGRYDIVCPLKSAWDLHKAWPEADFLIVPDAGHSVFEAGICRTLVQAADRFADVRRS